MKSFRLAVACSLALFVGFAVTAVAGPVGVQRQPVSNEAAVSQLEAAKGEVARLASMPTTKGPLMICTMTKMEELDKLISRLKKGEQIPSDEIRRVWGRC